VKKHLDSLTGENRELYRLLSKKLVEVADGRADKNYDEMKKLLE
jgi:hypothetical protein